MIVFLLLSDRRRNGGEAENEILCVCSSLRIAQNSLAQAVDTDLQYGGFDHVKGDGGRPVEEYDIHELSRMFPDDPSFVFDVSTVSLWEGEDFLSSGNAVTYVSKNVVFVQ